MMNILWYNSILVLKNSFHSKGFYSKVQWITFYDPTEYLFMSWNYHKDSWAHCWIPIKIYCKHIYPLKIRSNWYWKQQKHWRWMEKLEVFKHVISNLDLILWETETIYTNLASSWRLSYLKKNCLRYCA